MSEIWQESAEEIARRVRSGRLSAVEVFDACLERVRAVEPKISAYLNVLAEAGRRQAAAVDRRRADGEELGPLAGVPVAIKDNISLRGQPLTCGSRILDGYVAPYSATALERLSAADAVLLGKCNLDEYGMGSSCENSRRQLTRNPWHLGRVPGGSSGGSAATVAAGGVPLALGSDTGGSVRQPAAFCGIVGLKPTYGRVSRYGLVAFVSSTDQIGPLTRSVRDAALALSVIAGGDGRDSTSARRPVDAFPGRIEEGIAGLRVGVVREVDPAELEPASRRTFERALALLEGAGAELRQLSIPAIRAAIACYYVIATSEASANLARFDGIRYGRRAAVERSFADLQAGSRSAGFGAEVKRRIMLGTFALSAGYYDAYYGRAQRVRETQRREFAAAFESVDALVMPTAPGGAFAIGERIEDPLAMYLSDIFTTPASLAGLPALSVPSGCDDRGMPLALQIMAPPFAEATALRVGRAFEKAVDFQGEPGFVEPPTA